MSKEPFKPTVTWNPEYLRFDVSSERYEGHTYRVSLNLYYDEFECTCPWGRGRAKHTKKDCKHVIAVKEWLKVEANNARVIRNDN